VTLRTSSPDAVVGSGASSLSVPAGASTQHVDRGSGHRWAAQRARARPWTHHLEAGARAARPAHGTLTTGVVQFRLDTWRVHREGEVA